MHRRRSLILLTLLLWLPASCLTAQGVRDPELQGVRSHIDRGDAEAALVLLKKLTKGKPSAEALLLRSTALIMKGDLAGGVRDLDKALKLDPNLRQGWLNKAGLAIAEGRYDDAYALFLRARDLAPEESDVYLNLGAVLTLKGELEGASEHFSRYLEAHPDSAEAYFLVASNYALSGAETEVVEHLRRAIELDERMRLRARGDERFVALVSPEYRKLLTTDVYRPPPGAHTAAAAFKEAYERKDPKLVYAVLDALKSHGFPYDPTVEANDGWALIWSREMRIKLFNQQNGTGAVQVSALERSFTPDEWAKITQDLFRAIYESLERSASLR